MLLQAIYGYLIFSVCCGGILTFMLWLDKREERAQALAADQSISVSNTTAADSTANVATDSGSLKTSVSNSMNNALESEAA